MFSVYYRLKGVVHIARDNFKEENNTSNKEFDNISQIDKEDLYLLNIQAEAQIFMIYSYMLQYVSTLQGIEVIRLKYSENYESQPEPDPDKTAFEAAKIQVLFQSILTQISVTQYGRFYEHYEQLNADQINVARFATYEILLGNIVSVISYLLNYIGVKNIYKVDHNSPIYGD
ncbi:hypothetical protein FDB23_13470 [Clostridium botulinum]|nr:hypothetical protein [Clostridium botulinum]NFG22907.1 hypothetical protein [Clostridium botulinum]NFO05101.1 hypothetical protein [Clostridium botulinum]NFR15262.1 hypothetical protein [Clostridium botulinum]NFR44032.1 hypothetical protein [Clostridium botulinum]